MISTKSSVVSIDEIDLLDQTFRISVERDIARLTESIQRMGIIAPPLLIRKASSYRIVSGFQRIEACRRLKPVPIPARILEEGTEPSDCAQIAIAENSLQRSLNLIETSRALNLLCKHIQQPDDLQKTADTLGLPCNLAYIQKIRKLAHLPGSLQESLLSQRISMDTALRLGDLGDDGAAILEIFNQLILSHSKQKEMLTTIQEISIREGIGIQHLLAETSVQDILNDDDLVLPLKTKQLRNLFKQRRYPTLSAAENQFSETLKNLKLGDRMTLKPADHFEGDAIHLQIAFKDAAELERHLNTLSECLKGPHLNQLFKRYQPGE